MTKSQLSPVWAKIKKKHWKCNQHLIKLNFGGKNFEKFFLKNISPTFHHHPGLALKTTSRVVISTENEQTMQFRVLKHLFLSSAPWKTTEKTYISINQQIWKKKPWKGVFFSPINPRGTWTRVLPGSSIYILHREPLPLCLTKFQKNTMDGSKVME